MLPKWPNAAETRRYLRSVAQISFERNDTTSIRLDFRGCFLGLFGMAPIGNHNVRTVTG